MTLLLFLVHISNEKRPLWLPSVCSLFLSPLLPPCLIILEFMGIHLKEHQNIKDNWFPLIINVWEEKRNQNWYSQGRKVGKTHPPHTVWQNPDNHLGRTLTIYTVHTTWLAKCNLAQKSIQKIKCLYCGNIVEPWSNFKQLCKCQCTAPGSYCTSKNKEAFGKGFSVFSFATFFVGKVSYFKAFECCIMENRFEATRIHIKISYCIQDTLHLRIHSIISMILFPLLCLSSLTHIIMPEFSCLTGNYPILLSPTEPN